MSWKKEIEELRRREKLAEEMGGPEKLKRQKDNDRLNIRERITLLLDANSFHEIGKIAGKAEYDEDGNLENFIPANFVVGRGFNGFLSLGGENQSLKVAFFSEARKLV